MLFNSFQYWIFFFIVLAFFYSVPFRVGKVLLLLASYVFYMWWDPRFIVLILTSTVVDYFLGILLEVASGRRKRFLLVVSLVVNLRRRPLTQASDKSRSRPERRRRGQLRHRRAFGTSAVTGATRMRGWPVRTVAAGRASARTAVTS